MSRKNGGIDIPVAAIVLAYIFCWPVGLVLTILKWIPFNTSSSGTNRTHIPNSPSTQEEQYRQYQEKFEQYRKQQYGQKTSNNTNNSGSTLHTTNTSQMRTNTNTGAQSGPQTQAEQMRSHGNTYSQNQGNNYNQNSNQYRRGRKKKFKSSVTGFLSVAAIIMIIIGTVSGIDAISSISSFGFEMSLLRDLLMSGYLFAGGGAMFVLRKIIKSRDAMFNRYIAIIGNRESMYIPTVAAAMSVSVKKAKKDLQILIDKGYFGDSAYIDMSNNNIMMHSGAVPESGPEFDFRATYDSAVFGDKKYDKTKNKTSEQKTQDNTNQPKQAEAEAAPEEEIKIEDETDFAKILREIRRMNDAIDDEQVSERIYTIENITRNIFDYVGTNPDKLTQIRTFMNYYLPTTLKLLNSYSQIEKMGVAGQNMKNAKDNIEKILDMLVEGFQQQLDQLYKSEVLDISSDIEVLEQMMYKDGLAEKTIYDMFGGSGAATVSNPEDEEFPLE